jgi:hypothetical protein
MAVLMLANLLPQFVDQQRHEIWSRCLARGMVGRRATVVGLGSPEHRTQKWTPLLGSIRCSLPPAAHRSVRKTGSTFPHDALSGGVAKRLRWFQRLPRVVVVRSFRSAACSARYSIAGSARNCRCSSWG